MESRLQPRPLEPALLLGSVEASLLRSGLPLPTLNPQLALLVHLVDANRSLAHAASLDERVFGLVVKLAEQILWRSTRHLIVRNHGSCSVVPRE